MTQGKGKKNAYLSSYGHGDGALRVLIDTYRLRVELDHHHRGEHHGMYCTSQMEEGVVWANGDAVEDFQRFLDLAEVSNVLPEWWRFEDRMQCLSLALDKDDPENIFKPIDQSQLMTKYEGDTSIRHALCIVAELVVGYDGKGPTKDDKWFEDFQEHLDLHPQERARLIDGTVEAVKQALGEHGRDLQAPVA